MSPRRDAGDHASASLEGGPLPDPRRKITQGCLAIKPSVTSREPVLWREKSQRKSTIWCAPRLCYLAVRLYNRDGKGRDVTALIDDLTGITAR
jgi:hypothetical protein